MAEDGVPPHGAVDGVPPHGAVCFDSDESDDGWSNPEGQDRRKRFLREAPIDDHEKPEYRVPDERYPISDIYLEDLIRDREEIHRLERR